MKLKWDALLSVTLVVCALITTGLVVHREFFASASASLPAGGKPLFVHDWKTYLPQGTMLGPSSAPVQLIEFADFECPACGDYHRKLKALRERYPIEVSITYVHFPLQGHRFALAAARVAECAADQGRFEAMYDHLFDGQESFGVKAWGEYAAEAGVPDVVRFDACIKDTRRPMDRIEFGKQLGAKLDVKGTPTLIVNGWMFSRPPDAGELDAMVKAVLDGKNPVLDGHKS